jgi:hypothetical protein
MGKGARRTAQKMAAQKPLSMRMSRRYGLRLQSYDVFHEEKIAKHNARRYY